ncbi:hypothetical protein PTKIN_Ptkin14bG0123000 [Pterospermum kingtungense]
MANSPDQTTSLSSKGQEASPDAGDKISNFPDYLIHQILSFLPTKQAVETSVLSKRWVRLWTLVPNLDLDDSDLCPSDEQAKMKFENFVFRVLLLNKAGSVEKFRLNCNGIYGHLFIQTWICSAIERDLQEVDISVPEIANEDLVELPSDLFFLKTLKILKLHGEIMVDVPGSVCLPSLKILHLCEVKYANVESIRCFILACPKLEELLIGTTLSPENMVNLNISTPTLNTLYLRLNYFFSDEAPEKKININAPALKYLDFNSWGLVDAKQYFVENFPCIREANISVPVPDQFYRSQLLKAVSGVKCLRLTWMMPDDFVDIVPEHDFPLFVNLTRLELRGSMSWVPQFLDHSPKLETLVLRNVRTCTIGGCGWRWPSVPTCVLSSLSRVCFENFEGSEEEVEMIEYFLKNARVLSTVEIYTSDLSSDSKLCLLKRLSRFPRSSETCQLSFN